MLLLNEESKFLKVLCTASTCEAFKTKIEKNISVNSFSLSRKIELDVCLCKTIQKCFKLFHSYTEIILMVHGYLAIWLFRDVSIG